MSDLEKAGVLEKDIATDPANVSDGQMLEQASNNASSQANLKPRHLYMIAMGGKKKPSSFVAVEHPIRARKIN